MGIVITGDAFNIFVFLEISSLATYILVAMGAYKDKRALTAAYDYLILGTIGATFFVIGIGFLLCLFFSPLATSLPKEIDAAALIYIATLFVRNITDIEWDDIGEAAPAILAMIAMPLTYSISNGIALAFVSYALILSLIHI